MKTTSLCTNCHHEAEHCHCNLTCERCGRLREDCKCCDVCESIDFFKCRCAWNSFTYSKWYGYCAFCGQERHSEFCYCHNYDNGFARYLERNILENDEASEEDVTWASEVMNKMYSDMIADREFNYGSY